MTDRRWIDTDAEVPDIRDTDGLPQWVETRDGGLACGDRTAVVAAWFFSFKGFDLPDFDRWLSALEPCGAKTELLERRSLAIQASKDSKRDAVLRHLEWMMLRRQYLDREGFLLPLARSDRRHRDSQADKARRPRRRITTDVENAPASVAGIVESLKHLKDELGDPLPPSELWPEVYSILEEMRAEPKEICDDNGNPIELRYTGGSVKYDSFKVMLSKARNAKR